MNESEILERIATIFARNGRYSKELILGIGDDGAVISASDEPSVLTTDCAIEGIHFKREWSSLREIGAKVAAANLADVYAMGGVPKFLLVAAAIPKGASNEIFELAEGIAAEADLVDAQIIGGDLSSSEKIMITITAVGTTVKPVKRSGAKVGDLVVVTGLTGWSNAGLNLLQRGLTNSDKAISEFKKPNPPYSSAEKLALVANSMCDVSDGLLSEANQVGKASSVTLEIDPELISKLAGFSELAKLGGEISSDHWEWVLSGGEDHQFLATVPADSDYQKHGAFKIGTVKAHGKKFVELVGRELPNEVGFSHF
jgi:thiamine-monophosphate kinase